MIEACPRSALYEGELLSVRVDGTRVLLVTVDGTVHAYLDRCAHLGVRLSEGTLDGHTLTCRAHCWQYDVRSGHGINPASARLRAVPVRVEGDRVFVDPEAAT